eukprot:TRINITY_DN11022_c0_g1_i1.p1 TRINITY_DN11022_c0_g1~~TRINITY_DN11022_c0_g1_i1.p1  ORF type:complete len:360 (+),score=133.32 TRINITY_DN11022_c0_g1_i1:132-1211(+)
MVSLVLLLILLKELVMKVGDEWQKNRARKAARNNNKHIIQGIGSGVKDLGTGIFDGITGVVVDPLKGARNEGGMGFIRGVRKGLTGLVLKPIVGVVDMVTDTTEGIKNTAIYFDEKNKFRVRPPRYIGNDKILYSYNFVPSLGQLCLKTLEDGEFQNHYYFRHWKIGESRYLILSNLAVFIVTGKQATSMKMRWSTPYSSIINLQKSVDGIETTTQNVNKITGKVNETTVIIEIPKQQLNEIFSVFKPRWLAGKDVRDTFMKYHTVENIEEEDEINKFLNFNPNKTPKNIMSSNNNSQRRRNPINYNNPNASSSKSSSNIPNEKTQLLPKNKPNSANSNYHNAPEPNDDSGCCCSCTIL